MPTLTRIDRLEDRDAISVRVVEKTPWPRDSPEPTSSDLSRLEVAKRAPSFQGCKLLLKLMIDEDKNAYFLHPSHNLTSDLGSIQDEMYSGSEPPTPDEFCSLIRSTFENVHSSDAEVKVKQEARRLLDIFESSIALIDTPESRAKHLSVRFGMTGDAYFRNQISISSRKIQNAFEAEEEQGARFTAEVTRLKNRFKEFDCRTLKDGNPISNFHTQISRALARKSNINVKVSHVKGKDAVTSSDADLCLMRLTQLGISNDDESSPFTLSPFVRAFHKIDENLTTAKSGQEDVIGLMFYEHMKKFMLSKEKGSDMTDMADTVHRVNGAVATFEDTNNRLAQANANDPDSAIVYMRGLCQIVEQLETVFPLA